MEIKVKTLPDPVSADITLVELAGDIDGSTAGNVQEQVLPLVVASVRMILDMTQVSYMSSAGLRLLLSLHRQVVAKAGQVVLVGISEEIQDTMSITGFLDFFKTSDTIEAGRAILAQSA
jgi:anti-sigma B factor antagonist